MKIKKWIVRAKLAVNALINDRKNLELIKKQNEILIKNQESIILLLKLLASGGGCEHDGNIIIEKGTRYQTGENMKIKSRDFKGG